jgi:hypothetical protein
MAHPNIERRRVVAELSRFAVRFDPPVLRALSAEFNCSEQAIQRDLRVVQSEEALSARLDLLRSSSRFR